MASHRIATSLRSSARAYQCIPPSCSRSSRSASGVKIRYYRSFSIAVQRRAKNNNDNTYYVATLPWAEKDQDRKERFDDLIQNATFTDNDKIVASSITTSKRASPIASSLKAEIEHLNSTADKTGGGAWLLIKADTEEQAQKILDDTNAGEVFDLKKSTLQVVQLDQQATDGKGPLYDNKNDNDKRTSSNSSEDAATASTTSAVVSSEVSGGVDDAQHDLLSGNIFEGGSEEGSRPTPLGSKPKSRRKKSENKSSDKTDRGASENAQAAEETRRSGHEVETSGPLYGK